MGFLDQVTVPNIPPFSFEQSTDPALVATNNITAGKGWVDTSAGSPYQLKIRNAGNTGWDLVGSALPGTSTFETPPARVWRASRGTEAPTIVTTSTLVADGLHNGFPGLCVDRTGRLVCVYRTGTAHVSLASILNLRTSTDGGATWSGATVLLTAAAGHDYRDPSICCTATGRLLVNFFDDVGDTGTDFVVYVTFSDDNGTTWSSPAPLSPYGVLSVTSGTIFQHSSGVLLLPVYKEPGSGETSGVMRSTDNGLTWGSVINLSGASGYDEMNMVELPNHDLLTFVRFESATDGTYVSLSTDAGLTWSALTGIGFATWGGRASPVLVPISQMLILFYRSATSSECAWRYSTDLGATWSSETVINTNGYVYAGACALGDHLVGIVYGDQYSGVSSADLKFVSMTAGVPTVSGTRQANGALASLLSGLAQQGEIIDTTTAGTVPTPPIYAPLLDSAHNLIVDSAGTLILAPR